MSEETPTMERAERYKKISDFLLQAELLVAEAEALNKEEILYLWDVQQKLADVTSFATKCYRHIEARL